MHPLREVSGHTPDSRWEVAPFPGVWAPDGAVSIRLVDQARAALLVLDTRLDPRDWRPPAHRAGARGPVFARLDAVVIMRMHGLVLAVHEATPAVAVDPVLGGGTVSAQAAAWRPKTLRRTRSTAGGGGASSTRGALSAAVRKRSAPTAPRVWAVSSPRTEVRP